MTESTDATTDVDATDGEEQKFTQTDIDRLVAKARGEEKRKATEKFADYDDLKSKAAGAQTVEQQLADVNAKLAAADARALRSDIAARYGIGAEDRDLFLTGTDEASLDAQAKRLAEREADRKKNGNTAPKEGGTKTTGKGDEAQREFVRGLFGQPD